jgi:hypothetical protein
MPQAAGLRKESTATSAACRRQRLTATDRLVLPFRQRSPGLALSAGRPASGYENNTYKVSNHNDLLYLVYFACLCVERGDSQDKKKGTTGSLGPSFPFVCWKDIVFFLLFE